MSTPFDGEEAVEQTEIETESSVGSDDVSASTPDVTDAPTDSVSGQAEDGGNTAAEPRRLDVSEFGEALAPIKIDGVEQWVPLSEALNGYQRQEVFTRGQQETAQARALMNALESNPQAALDLLNRQYGSGNQAQAQQTQGFEVDGLDANDPLAREVQELRAWQMNQELDRTLVQLSEKYQDTFNEQELLAAAAAWPTAINHPSELENVFRQIKFDEMFAKVSAQDTARQQAAQATAQRVAAGDAAANAISSGNGVPNGSVGAEPETFDSIEAAWAGAKRTLGVA